MHGDPGVPPGLAQNDWKMFDPRMGLAWDVRGDGKTSIRVGAGIYHDQPFGRMYNQMMTSFPFVSAIRDHRSHGALVQSLQHGAL